MEKALEVERYAIRSRTPELGNFLPLSIFGIRRSQNSRHQASKLVEVPGLPQYHFQEITIRTEMQASGWEYFLRVCSQYTRLTLITREISGAQDVI